MGFIHISTCKHPVRILNKHTGRYMYVGCGKCDPCVYKLRMQWSERIKTEFNNSVCALFVTLNYKNENLPKVYVKRIHDKDGKLLKDRIICDSNRKSILELIKKHESSLLAKDYYIPHYKLDKYTYDNTDTFGVVCKKDIQNFLKRCRRRLEYHYVGNDNKSFRYFICSEYGPKTFRPHYHAIFFFRSHDVAKYFQVHVLPQSWKNSITEQIKCESAGKGSAVYISKYVGKFTSCPAILQLEPFRTFHLQSKCPCFGSRQVLSDDAIFFPLQNHANYIDSYWSKTANCVIYRDVPFSVSFRKQFFPKLVCSNQFSFEQFYEIVKFVYEWWKDQLNPPILKKMLDFEVFDQDKKPIRDFHLYKPISTQIKFPICDMSKYLYLNESKKSPKWSEVGTAIINDGLYIPRNMRKFLFGIPQNRTFVKRLCCLFDNYIGQMDPALYCFLEFRDEYNAFYNCYDRQRLFHNSLLLSHYSPLDIFMYLFPSFVEDNGVLPALQDYEFFDTKYDMLDLLLSNYDLRVEDLYDENGKLLEWKYYYNDRRYKDYIAFVKEENRKFYREREYNYDRYDNGM